MDDRLAELDGEHPIGQSCVGVDLLLRTRDGMVAQRGGTTCFEEIILLNLR